MKNSAQLQLEAVTIKIRRETKNSKEIVLVELGPCREHLQATVCGQVPSSSSSTGELGWTEGRAMKVQDIGHLHVSETVDQRHHRELQSSGGTEKTSRIIISQPVPYQFDLMLSSLTKF